MSVRADSNGTGVTSVEQREELYGKAHAQTPNDSIMEGRSKLRTATDALMATIIGISRRLLVAAAIREAVGYS